MSEATRQTMALLSGVVRTVPVGTNLGLLQVLWAMMSGWFLLSRGAVLPALALMGLERKAVRRAWQALSKGNWSVGMMLLNFERLVIKEGHWHRRQHGGFCALAADTVGFERPQLQNCPTQHYNHQAGKQVKAVALGLLGRVGQVTSQRLVLLQAIVRCEPEDNEEALLRRLARKAKQILRAFEVLVIDGGAEVEMLQQEGVERFICKMALNCTARQGSPPAYKGRGRYPRLGEIVRPLPRSYGERLIARTEPERSEIWTEPDGRTVRAEIYQHLVLRTTQADQMETAARFHLVVIRDPHYKKPWVLAYNFHLAAVHVYRLYQDRWAIEQVPLAAKQMIGCHRAFVWLWECCQRLPELALLAGSILSYAAAVLPALPTGFWDPNPRPTPGRLRRHLMGAGFPTTFDLPPEIRQKRSFTDHLPTGFWGQKRRPRPAQAA